MYYVIGKDNCPYCDKAKAALEKNNTPYVYKNLSRLAEAKRNQWVEFIKNELGLKTVPVCLKVGTSVELEEWLND